MTLPRLRQLVIAAAQMHAIDDLMALLDLCAPYDDPGVKEFGLRNGVFAIGDQFLEIVVPQVDTAPAARFLKRGGPGGYMAIFQTGDLAAVRARADAESVRRIWDIDLDDISASHFHPSDIGAAIVSVDEARPADSWRWGGPDWRRQSKIGRITGAVIEGPDPDDLAARWGGLLGVKPAARTLQLEDALLTFRDGAVDRLAVFELTLPDADDVLARGEAAGALRGDSPTMPFGGGEEIAWAHDSSGLYFAARQSDAQEPASTNVDIYWSALDGKAPANLTGALLTVPTEKAIFRLWVYDPYLQSQRSGLEDPFATGVGGLAMVSIPAKIGGLPGMYSLKFTGTTRTGPPSEILPPVLQPIPGGQWGRQKGTGSVTVSFQQFLKMDRDNPGKGLGLFGQFFVTDGDPNPLDWSAFGGVSGDIPGRPQDKFGLAYFHYSLSNELVSDLSPFIAFEDEYGVEAFYTLGIAKWLNATADVQYVNSSIAARGNAVIGTFVLQTRF